MKIISIVNLVNHLFCYVIKTSKDYNIDESHALKHSIDVYKFANKIYNSEVKYNPYLKEQKKIIITSAILHDMCDKKYINEQVGINMIKDYCKDYISEDEINIIENIILTMSYSKVKKNGYPELNDYELAYHIVREADLLAAYDIDRTIIYSMYKENLNYHDAIKRTIELFKNRVLQYRNDNLFITNFSEKESLILHEKAVNDLIDLKELHDI